MKNRILSYSLNPRLIIFLLAAADPGLALVSFAGLGFSSKHILNMGVGRIDLPFAEPDVGNVAALFLSGYLPNSLLHEFWMYSYLAEIDTFSATHFQKWSAYTAIDVWPLSSLGVSILVFGVGLRFGNAGSQQQ